MRFNSRILLKAHRNTGSRHDEHASESKTNRRRKAAEVGKPRAAATTYRAVHGRVVADWEDSMTYQSRGRSIFEVVLVSALIEAEALGSLVIG